MPRENKKRGRRAEAAKRKADEDVEDSEETSPKRQRLEDDRDDIQPLDDSHIEPAAGNSETPFYGLLDDEEQEYFRRADDMLEANQFADPEERQLFLDNVWKEADGKELKMACSQSSSRLLERLISLSTPSQLKRLFQKFSGQ